MIYPALLDTFIFPVTNIFMGRKFWFIYHQLQKSQWFNREQIEQIQVLKLRKLVAHAYATVPLYRQLMDNKKVRPEEIKTLADIKKLPIVSKKDFRQDFPDRCTSITTSRKDWIFDSTSGSTGSPFQFIRDKQFSDYALANTYRNYTWTGIFIGQRIASLWGFHTSSWGVKILDTLLRRKFFSSFDIEKNFTDYYLAMKSYHPVLIEAYSASITHFAKLLQENDITDLHIPYAISSAETLYPENRKLIEHTLHTQVFDRYGSREVGNVAHECREHKGLHINAETYIVEVVKDKPSDEKGHLVVTNLSNFTMPFIRYDTEDYAIASNKTCACGRGLPLLERVEGRITDFIKLPNGKELSFLFFNYFFEQYGAYLKQFQVIQDSPKHLLIKLVVTEKYTLTKEKELIAGIKKKVGDMNIDVEQVYEIKKETSGKLRPVKRLI
ncbi:phenylacetate--CoA ligase family protein [Candidatus Woesearchaeota archaeon]|nr:phenylacetate--CoA ligase family protein [Candidatus Woesearchaeota archaeon]